MSPRTIDVNVHHVTRVEGHGNIVLNVRNGTIEKLELQIVEEPRFFEAFVRGRRWYEMNHITSRICGICAVAHSCASLAATEAAMGIEVSEQTRLLRRLIYDGEMIQSHILHVYFLVAPDLLDVGSVIPLATSHPEVVKRALRLKRLANDICCVVGGRHVHPISMVPGGFTNNIKVSDLKALRERLVEAVPDLEASVELFAALEFPDFDRPTEYVSLYQPGEFAFLWADLYSSRVGRFEAADYRKVIEERVVSRSTAKHATTGEGPYAVGAQARVNNSFEWLRPEAKAAAEQLGWKNPVTNPYWNNVAQVIECVQCAYEAIAVIDELLDRGLRPEKPDVQPRAGRGVGTVEAPRGLLVHDYEYDDDGVMVNANVMTPTAQNVWNCETDLKELVPQIIDRSKEEIVDHMEWLVRAYDPCISCSVHLLDVEFVE